MVVFLFDIRIIRHQRNITTPAANIACAWPPFFLKSSLLLSSSSSMWLLWLLLLAMLGWCSRLRVVSSVFVVLQVEIQRRQYKWVEKEDHVVISVYSFRTCWAERIGRGLALWCQSIFPKNHHSSRGPSGIPIYLQDTRRTLCWVIIGIHNKVEDVQTTMSLMTMTLHNTIVG